MTLLDRQEFMNRKARHSMRDHDVFRGRRDSRIHFKPWIDLLEDRTMLSGMTYAVTSTADSVADGTLREAIIEANANPGENTIAFNLTANSTINLTLGPVVIDPATSGDGLNIINSGAGAVTIDASGNGSNGNNVNQYGASDPNSSTGQIFVINAASGDVQIAGGSEVKSITLRNATTADYGGAIDDLSSSVLDVDYVVFTGNTADNGGAIEGGNGFMDVSNCTFGTSNLDSNTATGSGGAIDFEGADSLTVSDSHFNDNQSNGGYGGAIRNFGTDGLVVEGSTFSGNEVTATDAGNSVYGGAIYTQSGNIVIDSSAFTSNEALGASGNSGTTGGGDAEGGAIYDAGDAASITKTAFSSNTAQGGTGYSETIGNSEGGSGGEANGGAFYQVSTSSLTVGNSVTFTGNSAVGGAGGSGSGTDAGGAGGEAYAGALDQYGSDCATISATFSGNLATGGAGGAGGATSGSGGAGGGAGGGAFYNHSYTSLTNSAFTASTVTGGAGAGGAGFGSGGAGGGVYGGAIDSRNYLAITNVAVSGTLATAGAGGIGGSDSAGPSGTGGSGGAISGGAIYSGSLLMLDSVTITGTTARAGAGGGGGNDTDNTSDPGGAGGAGGAIHGGVIWSNGNASGTNVDLGGSPVLGNTAIGGAGGAGGARTAGSGDGGVGGAGGKVLGGGLYNSTNLSLAHSAISYTTSTGGAGGVGGAGYGDDYGGGGGAGGAGGVVDGGGIDDSGSSFAGGVLTITHNTITGGRGGAGGNHGAVTSSASSGKGGAGGAASGGGLFGNDNTSSLIGSSTFDDNTVAAGTGGNGGSGVFLSPGGAGGAGGLAMGGGVAVHGYLTLSLDTVSGNSTVAGAGGNGGAGTVAGLGDDGGNGMGGGLGNTDNLTVIGGTISDNTVTAGAAGTGDGSPSPGAGNGGGIYNNRDGYVTQSTITGNMVTGSGGGVYNAVTGTLDLSLNTISSNTATFNGGGVANAGTISSAFNTTTGNTPDSTVGVSAGDGTTYVVTSTADSTSGNSLRHAILDANASKSSNTIEFDFAVNSTISLTLGPLVIDPSTAGYGLNIINTGAGTVTIDADGNGPNASNVNEYGGPAPDTSSGRIFEIDNASGDVQIDGQSAPVILQNAYANSSYGSDAGYGGAVFDESPAMLDISNVAFLGNVASVAGGAVFSQVGPMYVAGSTFGAPGHGNKTSGGDGGAIDYDGNQSITVSDSSFNDNVSNGGDGGALYANGLDGLAVLGASTFTSNTANGTGTVEGGAIYQDANPLVIDSTTFTSNMVQGGSDESDGGALYDQGTGASITNTAFTGNMAQGGTGGSAAGGAIFEKESDPVSISDNVLFTSNTAQGGNGSGSSGGNSAGGAIYVYNGSPVTVDATFTSNLAIGGAGQGNEQGGGNAEGGTIDNRSGAFLLNNSTISDSLAQAGAGSGGGGGGGNAVGGAISVGSNYFPFVIANTTFAGTQAIGGAGGSGDDGDYGGTGGSVSGGVYRGGGNDAMISDTTFTGGLAQGGDGGAGGAPDTTGAGGTGGDGGAVEGSVIEDTAGLSLLDVTAGGRLADANIAVGGGGGAGAAGRGTSALDYGGAGGAGGDVDAALYDNLDTALGNFVISDASALGGNGGTGGIGGTGGVGGDGGNGGIVFGGGIDDDADSNQDSLAGGGLTIGDNSATGGNGGNAPGVGGTGGGTRVIGGEGGSVFGAGYAGYEETSLLAISTISGNTALGGTGGNATSSGFTGGGAGGYVEGGAVYTGDGTLGLSLVTISGNTATGGAGGNTSPANVLGAPGTGGAAFGGGVANEETVGVISSTISDNTAVGGAAGTGNVGGTAGKGSGGGLYNHSMAYVKDSTFSSNSADYGGGLYNDAAATLDLSFSSLTDNTAAIAGPNVNNLGTFIDAFNTYIVARPITVTSPGSQSSTAGFAYAFSLGSFADPNEGATGWTEIINWGDSSTSTLGLQPGSLGTIDHTYASAAAYTATVAVTDNLTATGSNSFTANVTAPINPITVTSPGTQSSTAGVSHTFAPGSFTDPNGGPTTWTEIITWGDSTSTTLHLSPGSLGTLDHTYASAAAYTVTLSVTDNLTATGSNIFTASVSAPISPIIVTSPGAQSSTAGVTRTFALGSFADPDGASAWTETINWGDSSSSTLNLPPGALGTLAHTYASAGVYTVTVAVTDNLTGTGLNIFTANVSPIISPISVTSPGNETCAAGVLYAFALGSFSDPNASSSWTEVVNWGDSSSSTLHLPPGSLGTLAHTYASAGSYPVTFNVTDNVTGAGSNAFTANISPAVSAITVSSPGAQSSTAGVAHTFALGSFADPNAATSWTESINWGDSSSSTLNLPPGSLGDLAHTYALAGAYAVTVTVTDNMSGTGSNEFTANVSNSIAPITVTSPGSQSSGAGLSQVYSLGSFTDPNVVSSWTEIIKWGDGSNSTLNLPPGSLESLDHTYTSAGAYLVAVIVTDNVSGTGSNTFTTHVSPSVVPITVTSPGNQPSLAGVSHAFALGTFADLNPASSWTEVINWGDSSSSTVTLPPGSLGTLGHNYTAQGTYLVTVTVTDNLTGTGSTAFSGNVSPSVTAITVTSAGTQSSTAAVSQTFPLGSFADPNPASSWTETINWGDSSSNTLHLPPGSLGSLAHMYDTAGTHSVAVAVTDNLGGIGSSTFTASVSANVSPITVNAPGTQAAERDVAHAFSLGSFADPNPTTSWTETIDWGDSSRSTLTLPPGSLGTLDHVYDAAGTYTVTVLVTDNLHASGSSAWIADVSNSVAPINITLAGAQTSVTGVARAFLMGSFADPNPASSWTETVSWGDSSTTTFHLPPGSLGKLNHVYAAAGAYAVTITVIDNLSGVGTNAFNVDVSTAASVGLALTAVGFSKPAKSSARIEVASFTSTNKSLSAGAYSVTIIWSDGSTTGGTISGSGGKFKVTSKHVFNHLTKNNDTIAVVKVWETATPSTKRSIRSVGTITHSVSNSSSLSSQMSDLALSQLIVKKKPGSV